MSPYKFSTKAATLSLLRDKLEAANVVPLVYFTVSDWLSDKQSCLVQIRAEFNDTLYIVRSSCLNEDTAGQSNAGAYLTLLNVSDNELESAINQVINSYSQSCNDDQVLIQPMLKNTFLSGVAFSHEPNTCSPYRIINWSETSDTTAITSGAEGESFTWQQAAKSALKPPAKLEKIVTMLEELLILFGNTPLDCEFALTQEKQGITLWLLQVRCLILMRSPESEAQQQSRLNHIHNKLVTGMSAHPFLMGKTTAYGIMPDWNPAEIIGVRPKPLALSLYRDLVTDSIWAYQRHNYGYRNLRSFPLMPHFFGMPYIDLRLSFNSFIPADLEENLAGRLVDYYIERLISEPALHDKVEFEIVFSCYSLDLPERLKSLAHAGFSKDEINTIAKSLIQLTNRIVHTKEGLWKADAAKIDVLKTRYKKLQSSDVGILDRIYWLLEDAKRYGTLPFAGLARAGFIAVQMLGSLVRVGVLSNSDYDAFMASISTISGKLAHDRAILDKGAFLARYGHLRPGTYDILSHRYDEKPEIYFDWEQQAKIPEPPKPFSITLPQMREMAKLLASHGLQPDPIGLFDFIQAGVEQRELAKFYFSRNLSDALALIGKFAEQYGISREEIAYCDINVFKELYITANNPVELLRANIEEGKKRYQETLNICLPPLITKPDDIWAFKWLEACPNFITQKQVTAEVADANERKSLSGAIICIPNADPGYDWLFLYPIAGLVTCWGGANSHMAIRAGELGLPAVIGAGEALYKQWSAAQFLRIDCAGKKVEVLM